MGGDYSRFTFGPRRDYSGIFKQQGRVDLDADFNELIEMVDRRWRSETIDIIGHCIVPNTTPDAFLVTPTSLGDFDIGIGRMYVDGIQVENHGRPPLDYQADLGEMLGTTPIPYSDQPYLPAPLPPVLAAAPGTSDLVYIDVWQREVTVLEDPSLREIALGGPDTTTRIQSAWQVRALQDVGPHACSDDIPAWDALVAPSAGRLTTSAVAPPASDDPCIISPSGGYRGLENRLYRVEIHSVGPIGGGAPAKFKWSRNNATIASSVSAIPLSTEIIVQQIGRDQVLRFRIGDWIEITDDFREFQGLAGHMAQVTNIDEANRVLTFNPAIPGSMNFNAADPSRHTRVRRWDQTQNVDANGLLDVAAGPIDIEDGIRVTFNLDPPSGSFKIGDYWVFAARTADGSVEILQDAPPRGILHHFCRLGFINWGTAIGTTTFTDCREHWPPGDCDCCTVTVGDGVDSHGQFTDIQQAINSLGSRGGLVCIGRGFYPVTTGLIVNSTKSKVRIQGMGDATRIFFAPAQGASQPFLEISNTEHVSLESVFVAAADVPAMVRINQSNFCRIQDCTLVNLPVTPNNQISSSRGIDFVEDCVHCEINHNLILAAKGVSSTTGHPRELIVQDNQILALQASVFVTQVTGIEILHNQMRGLPRTGFGTGLSLTRTNMDAFQVLISTAFRAPVTLSNFQAAAIVIFTGNRVVISQNLITAQIGVMGFLFINARIQQNDILALMGLLSIFSILIKVEDNFVLGIFAGLIHAGIVVDMDCTSNEWIGLHGIIWMSLAELQRLLAPLATQAISSAGLSPNPAGTVNTTLNTGKGLAGNVQGFGLAAINKIHRNVFLTFLRGIFKSDAVVSADISIVDNSFSFCSVVGIELGGSARNTALLLFLARVISLRHLLQGNALAVTGRGISSSSIFTQVEQNNVQCPSVAIELDAGLCTARGNSLLSLATTTGPDTDGLLVLRAGAQGAQVTSNSLSNAPSHGILIREDLIEVAIDDNQIRGARRFGIGTFTDTTVMSRSSLSRNRLEACRGELPLGSLRFSGAMVVGESHDLRVIGNVVTNNQPAPATGGTAGGGLRWYAIYLEDSDGVEVSGNLVNDNATQSGLIGSTGAVGLQGVRGIIQVQNNVVRNNGGTALAIAEGRNLPNLIQHVLVQNNHFSGGLSTGTFLVGVLQVDTLLFQGNHCMRSPLSQFQSTVSLLATRANVTGNVVDLSGFTVMSVSGNDLVVSANSVRFGSLALSVAGTFFGLVPGRVILTSNLTTGISATSTGLLVRSANIPAP